jgi:hypothetical protein
MPKLMYFFAEFHFFQYFKHFCYFKQLYQLRINYGGTNKLPEINLTTSVNHKSIRCFLIFHFVCYSSKNLLRLNLETD